MKYVLIVLAMTVLSCQSNKKSLALSPQQSTESLLFYSKGPCLGKCEVYDFELQKDGIAHFKKYENKLVKDAVIGKVQNKELKKIQSLLNALNFDAMEFQKIKDIPVTKLVYQDKRLEYHASRVTGDLKKLNSLIENLTEELFASQIRK